MADKIQVRRDTAANWNTENTTLSQGEFGFETDTGELKIGNGTTSWNSLDYNVGSADPHEYIKEIHVDLDNGNDSNNGQVDTPLLTIEAAWAQRLLDNSTRYAIYVHGTSEFPTTVTLDGSTGGADGMFTYLIGDTVGTGRWEVGPATLKVFNAGAVTFGGFGFYQALEIASDTFDNYVNLSHGWYTGTLTVVGAPTNIMQLNLYGARAEFTTFTGNFSNFVSIIRDGAYLYLQQNSTFKNISLFQGAITLDTTKTLTVTGDMWLFSASGLGVESGSTATINRLFDHGGNIGKHPNGTVTITTLVNRSRQDSKFINFDPTGSELSSTDVEAAIKEVANAGGSFNDGSGTTWNDSNSSFDLGGTTSSNVIVNGTNEIQFAKTDTEGGDHRLYIKDSLVQMKYVKDNSALGFIEMYNAGVSAGFTDAVILEMRDWPSQATVAGISIRKTGEIGVGDTSNGTNKFQKMFYLHDYSSQWDALSATEKNRVIVDWEYIDINKLSDAASDGTQYARQDGSWTEVSASGGGATRLGELTDVQDTTYSEDNILSYNSGSSFFSPIASTSYYETNVADMNIGNNSTGDWRQGTTTYVTTSSPANKPPFSGQFRGVTTKISSGDYAIQFAQFSFRLWWRVQTSGLWEEWNEIIQNQNPSGNQVPSDTMRVELPTAAISLDTGDWWADEGIPTIYPNTAPGDRFEADLSTPSTNGYVLSSTTVGTRSWIENGVLQSEATWTPTTTNGAVTNNASYYVKTGKTVTIWSEFNYTTNTNNSAATVSEASLPFEADLPTSEVSFGTGRYNGTTPMQCVLAGSAAFGINFNEMDGTVITAASLSGLQVEFSMTYRVTA